MNLIERYVEAVKRFLPSDVRDDVAEELRTNILDMLPENYSEKEVFDLLTTLGNPRDLANEYNPKKRYLIGPSYYDKYLSALKLVIGIVAIVAVFIALVVWIIESPSNWYNIDNIIKLFVDILSAGIFGAFQGLIWVTLVFIIIERSGADSGLVPFFNKKWSPKDLPDPINNQIKIARGETIFAMVVTIIIVAIIYFYPEMIAYYTKGDNQIISKVPLFINERLDLYIPFILILTFVQFVTFIWKFITESWTKPLVIINAIYNFAFLVLFLLMITDKSLFNSNFISAIAAQTTYPITTVSSWLATIKWIFIVLIIILTVANSIKNYLKILKRVPNNN